MMTVDVDKRETRLCLVPPSVPRGVLALISCHASRVTSSKYFQLHKINARKRKKQLLFYLQRWPQLANQTQGTSTTLTSQYLTFKFVTRSSLLRGQTAVQASQPFWHQLDWGFTVEFFIPNKVFIYHISHCTATAGTVKAQQLKWNWKRESGWSQPCGRGRRLMNLV